VGAREQWQALQERLTNARNLFEAGDVTRALGEVDAALAVDPKYLAAHSLREHIAHRQPVVVAAPSAAELSTQSALSTTGYAKFEERVKRRRIDRRAEAVRAATACGRLTEATAALDEIRELDPNLPDLQALDQLLDAARRSALWSHRGARMTAAAAFVTTVFTWRLVTEPQALPAHPLNAPTVLPPSVPSESLPAVYDTPTATAAATANIVASNSEDLIGRPSRLVDASRDTRRIVEPVQAARPAAEPARDTRPAADLPDTRQAGEPARETRVDVRTDPPPQPAVEPTRDVPAPLVRADVGPPAAAIGRAMPLAALPAVDEEMVIQQALQRYRNAYDRLDARSARAVWPRVNEAALARAFGSLAWQKLTFDACTVQLKGEAATAMCRGTAQYVAKVGSRDPHVEPRVWNFTLQKHGADWTIETARAER
jgi:hypothetical protein